MKRLIILSLALMLLAACKEKPKLLDPSILKTGDLIFVWLDYELDSQTLAFLLKGYPVNHVGIIVKDERKGEWQVLEAWKHVRLTPLDKFLERAKGSVVYIKRLKNFDAKKFDAGYTWATNKMYMPYDRSFDWKTDYRFYNSELVIKVLNRSKLVPEPPLKPLATYLKGRKDKPRQLSIVPDDQPVALVDYLFELPILEPVFKGKVSGLKK